MQNLKPTAPPAPKICPILSVATIQAPQKVLTSTPQPSSFQMVPCQGDRCGFWVPLVDPSGKVLGGGCAATFIPQVLIGIQQTMQQGVAVDPTEPPATQQ